MGIGGGGLMSTMATGMAFGAGSEIAHQGVRAMMGGGSSGHGGHEGHQEAPQQQQYASEAGYDQQQQQQQAAPQQHPCFNFSQTLFSCLQQNKETVSVCQADMDALTMCEKSQQYGGYNNYQ